MDRDVAARLAEAAPDRRVQRAPRHAGRGRHGAGHARPDGAALHPLGPRHLGDRDRQGADQAGAGAARHPDAGRADRRSPPSCTRAIRWRGPMCSSRSTKARRSASRSSPTRAITAIRSRATSTGPWQEFDELLAEPFIRGRELTAAVLGDRALGVTELKPKSGFYDFDAKYTDGLTEHVCPARDPRRRSPTRASRIALRGAPAARLQGRSRAPTSAGTTSGASTGCSCSRSTPSRA